MLISKIINRKKAGNSVNQEYFDRFRSQRQVSADALEQATIPSKRMHATTELSEQIIGSYQTCLNDRQSPIMQQLAQQSLQSLADKRGVHLNKMQTETTYNQSASNLLEKMYSFIRFYSAEYNYAIGWNELYVTCTKPAQVTEVLRYNTFREPIETLTTVRARYSTRSWTLVARAYGESVEFFLLPAFKAIGLSRSEKNYEPILKFKAVLSNREVFWQLDGNLITDNELEQLSLVLFSSLVKSSQESLADENSNYAGASPNQAA